MHVLSRLSGLLLHSSVVMAVLVPCCLGGAEPRIEVVRNAGWSPGDDSREGAAEFVVLMQVARLQQSGAGGLVAVGDRHGRFSGAAEAALETAVLRGVPVVKLAPAGGGVANPSGLFLDGGSLSVESAQAVLARCLAKYGSWPADRAVTPRLRGLLERCQREFTLAGSQQFAAR